MDDDDDLWGPPRGKSGWINYGIYCFFFFLVLMMQSLCSFSFCSCARRYLS
jgi:hypothetical protein